MTPDQAHQTLTDQVAAANALFRVLERRTAPECPADGVVKPILLVSEGIASSLAALLEALLAGDEEELRPKIAELDQERGPPLHIEHADRCCLPGFTPTGRLQHFHEVLQRIGNRLFAEAQPRTHLFEELRRLYVRLKHTGGSEWGGGGLLQRVEDLSRAPWRFSEADVAALRQLEERAHTLRTLDAAGLEADARRVWTEGVDAWTARVERDPGPAVTMLVDAVRNVPGLDDHVALRLRRLAGLELLPAEVRALALERLEV